MRNIIIFLIILMMSGSAFSASVNIAHDFYLFNSEEQKISFERLTNQLRCLVCQNQTLADSNAPLANDLRQQIFTQLKNGYKEKDIREYLVARYGNFILYQPPFNYSTFALWIMPFLVLSGGIGFLIYYIKVKKR